MDDKWFKTKQKAAGVTAEDIAQKMGRDRSIVSRIYNGHQKMSLEWAKAFAEVLKVPLDQVLKHAGALEVQEAKKLEPSQSNGDAALWEGSAHEQVAMHGIVTGLGGGTPGIDVWRVRTGSMVMNGYSIGDKLLVDTNKSETCKTGDIVLALRRFEPPVLVSGSTTPSEQRVHVVDGKNVVIKGKVIASWRT
jgi:transcriptional regulator with XRE-family HTH domain